LGLIFGFSKFVDYILEEHKIISASRQAVKVNPRILIHNCLDENDETLTMRLAIRSSGVGGNINMF
jgi:hypothetical protein